MLFRSHRAGQHDDALSRETFGNLRSRHQTIRLRARRLGVDAEEGVRGTCERFTARFHHIEAAMRAEGRPVKGATMEELDARWEVAKKAVG